MLRVVLSHLAELLYWKGEGEFGPLESSFDIIFGNTLPSFLIEFNTSLSQLLEIN